MRGPLPIFPLPNGGSGWQLPEKARSSPLVDNFDPCPEFVLPPGLGIIPSRRWQRRHSAAAPLSRWPQRLPPVLRGLPLTVTLARQKYHCRGCGSSRSSLAVSAPPPRLLAFGGGSWLVQARRLSLTRLPLAFFQTRGPGSWRRQFRRFAFWARSPDVLGLWV